MSNTGVPLVDLDQWFNGTNVDKINLAKEVDNILQRVGFLVITNHQVEPNIISNARYVAKKFFALPQEFKDSYSCSVGERGWLSIGKEANAYSEGSESPPDLKESYIIGSEDSSVTGLDAAWFISNVWPVSPSGFREATESYIKEMRRLADNLMSLFAMALNKDANFFEEYLTNPSWSFQYNWYPSMEFTGKPQDGQFRIGPHTDFGTLTILDRQKGSGGLQVDIDGEGWVDAPWVDNALIINTGDLISQWTNMRWKSNRHRVLPPPSDIPSEELLSLVYFFESNPDAMINDIRAGDFLRSKYDAITV